MLVFRSALSSHLILFLSFPDCRFSSDNMLLCSFFFLLPQVSFFLCHGISLYRNSDSGGDLLCWYNTLSFLWHYKEQALNEEGEEWPSWL